MQCTLNVYGSGAAVREDWRGSGENAGEKRKLICVTHTHTGSLISVDGIAQTGVKPFYAINPFGPNAGFVSRCPSVHHVVRSAP